MFTGRIADRREGARVKSLSSEALRQLLQTDAAIALLDVRTEEERRIAMIPSARALEGPSDIEALDPASPVVVYCHHGIRSRAVAERLVMAGFSEVYNLEGGIDAWARTIDQTMARY